MCSVKVASPLNTYLSLLNLLGSFCSRVIGDVVIIVSVKSIRTTPFLFSATSAAVFIRLTLDSSCGDLGCRLRRR